MGVEHELHDLENRRRFELGKGAAARACAEAFYPLALELTRAAGEAALVQAMTEAWHGDNAEQGPDSDSYVRDWGARVWAFAVAAGWQIEVWNDVECGTGEETERRTWGTSEWPVVDSRYATGLKVSPA